MENEREGIRIESMQGGTGSAPAARHTRSYGSVGDDGPDEEGPPRKVQEEVKVISATRSYLAVAVLCYINLLNYMDRYTIAGVLLNIQSYFNIKDGDAGLLQTVFICSFMLLAPLFGYLGDRYNRKWLMVLAVFVWTAVTLGSSFVTQSHFWLLVVTRGLVGVGEASYSTIAPTIIGDLFTGALRTWMLSLFYIFIPVGSGLGYIVGSSVADITGDWHWALRVTPILGMVGIVLLIALVPEPPRGAADFQGEALKEKTSYWEDIKYLFANRSFVLSSLGVTAMAFMTGALAFWTPVFLSHAQVLQGTRVQCTQEPCSNTDSLIFGVVTVVTGIVGVGIGAAIARRLKKSMPDGDPLLCAVGMLGSAPCLYLAMVTADKSIATSYVFIALGETLLSLNWAVVADILLYVVIPTRRSTAEALQITVCHLLGDAGSPYLIGTISDSLRSSYPDSYLWKFRSLEYSFLLCPFVGVLGGLFFLLTALYVEKDRTTAREIAAGNSQQPAVVS
ncbi:protein spinster homolog 3-like isoform X2 [Acipenser ruthenus]|nr:protein spinster homolog 3-like isoform X2 [Acipenser ruthenus]